MKFVCKFLTALLVTTLAMPAHVAGVRDFRVVETPELLTVGRHVPGAHDQRLAVRQLPSRERARDYSVSYEESGVTRFAAAVSIGETTIDVDGTAGNDPFRMHWVDLGRGIGVEATFRFGDESFHAFVSDAGPDDVAIEDYARYRDHVAEAEGWVVVEQIHHVLQSAQVDSPLAVFAGVATFAAAGSLSTDSPSPIRNYLDCLGESCRTCGGCWGDMPFTACWVCPSQPLHERLIAEVCYTASSVLCLRHLLFPIPMN